MQCLARTRSFQRCRKSAVRVVCRTHRFQPWAAALFTFTSVGALVGFSRDLLEPWQRTAAPAGASLKQQSATSSSSAPNVTQSMINSPGGIQAAGNVTIVRSNDVLHSLFVDVTFEAATPDAQTGPPSWNEGIQMLGAIETADGIQIRLATDWRYEDHQQTARSRRLFFRFAPESPASLSGRSVDDLKRFTKILLGLKKAFEHFGFAQESTTVLATIRIVANGVEVAESTAAVSRAQLLAQDTSTINIAPAVAGISQKYHAAVE
jgi:hypothetical protein